MPLAATEVSDSTFLLYSVLLAVSGLIMLAFAITGFGAPTVGARLLNGLFGLGFVGYSVYLLFIFDGGSFAMFWYAFIVPILAIVQAVKSMRRKSAPAQ